MEADVHYLVPENRPVPREWLRFAAIEHPIAGGEGTGTPVQELSVDLDELALAQYGPGQSGEYESEKEEEDYNNANEDSNNSYSDDGENSSGPD